MTNFLEYKAICITEEWFQSLDFIGKYSFIFVTGGLGAAGYICINSFSLTINGDGLMIFGQMQSLMPEFKIYSLAEKSGFGLKTHHGYLNGLAAVIERVQHQIRMMPGKSKSSQHIT